MTADQTEVEIAIIGAGLAGLASALLLAETGLSVQVIDAQGRPGGRIRSVIDEATGRYLADLGPTWVWPTFQPTLLRWIDKLGLSTFSQFDEGQAVLDHGPDQDVEIRFLPGQVGNERLVGGPQSMIDGLMARLPETALQPSSPVVRVDLAAEGIRLQIGGGAPVSLVCERLIVAVPPRIAASGIDWQPGLPAPLAQALETTPTWMAPHAKAVALYDRAFWREHGLSGRIASRVGPLVEAHDHSGPDGEPAAIFGFVGWPHDMRAKMGADLEAHLRAQLQRCFGTDGPEPLAVHIEDWSTDPYVATRRDLAEPMDHPKVGPPVLRTSHADGRLWFAGSETARQSPGLIEGALVAAEEIAARILASQSPTRAAVS